MGAKVADASALAAILFNEPEADQVARDLGDAALVAPALLLIELANVCLVKIKRHPEDRERLTLGFERRKRFGVSIRPVDPDGVLRLALTTGLTAYDASYLWLSRHLGVALVSLDRQLLRAAAL